MKRTGLLLAAIFMMLFTTATMAQKKMKSPPATAKGTIDGVNIEVKYHQPSAKGRKIMGGLVPYDKVWRTGANNATTISFDKDVTIEGKDLAKGSYALFTIPDSKNWTIIFNKNNNQWGAYNYDATADVLRVKTKAEATDKMIETFVIEIKGDNVELSWENTRVPFEVKSK